MFELRSFLLVSCSCVLGMIEVMYVGSSDSGCLSLKYIVSL